MRTDPLTWSRSAWRMHKASRDTAIVHQVRRELEFAAMSKGPQLAGDGHTVTVPSEWYDGHLVEVWKSYGFYFNGELKHWSRDTRKLHLGQRYTAAAWLKFAKSRFFETWTNLVFDCITCGREFQPHSIYQVQCPDCAAGKPVPEPAPAADPHTDRRTYQAGRCTRCGRPVEDESEHLCYECIARGYL